MNLLEFDELDIFLLSKNNRIMHHVWFGTLPNKKEAKKAYDKMKIYRDSWINKNIGWFHIEWSKKMCEILVKKYFPQYASLYFSYKYEIQRCDTIRYMILYRYGGLYIDMDYYCNKPFDEALERFPNDLYLVSTPNGLDDYVSNSLMYSKKSGNIFWKKLLDYMKNNNTYPIYYSRHMIIMYTTGPAILTRVYNENKIKDKLSEFPHELFHPYGIGDDKLYLLDNDCVYAIHIGKGSWEKGDSKFILYLYTEWRIILFITCVLLSNLFILIYKENDI